jgi:hypothetical protein
MMAQGASGNKSHSKEDAERTRGRGGSRENVVTSSRSGIESEIEYALNKEIYDRISEREKKVSEDLKSVEAEAELLKDMATLISAIITLSDIHNEQSAPQGVSSLYDSTLGSDISAAFGYAWEALITAREVTKAREVLNSAESELFELRSDLAGNSILKNSVLDVEMLSIGTRLGNGSRSGGFMPRVRPESLRAVSGRIGPRRDPTPGNAYE